MKFIVCRAVSPPPLTDAQVRSILSGRAVDSPVRLKEGDCFPISKGGNTVPVFCSSSTDRGCRIRRMCVGEISYNRRNGGDSP